MRGLSPDSTHKVKAPCAMLYHLIESRDDRDWMRAGCLQVPAGYRSKYPMGKPKVGRKLEAVVEYQAKLATPFAVLGICIEEDWLTDIEYLPLDTPTLAPRTSLAREVCDQLQAYLAEPDFIFDLSLHIGGTIHQKRVWRAIQDIPSGKTRSYADIATQLHSAPRAVGQACGANRLPIVIPCHRVIAKNGELGGFMNASDGIPLGIKRWLLHHERG